MIFGLISVGTVILFSIFFAIRIITTVYLRDVDPYLRRSERPPIYDVLKTDTSIESEPEEPIKTYSEFVNDYNSRQRNQVLTQHEEFLQTKLGKSYLRILNGTNR